MSVPLTMVAAVSIPSSLPGVTAWVSAVTVASDGIAFTVVAQMVQRGVRYHPTAQAAVNGTTIDVGGSNSSSARTSMTQFWAPLDTDELATLTSITLYEADGYDADRAYVHTFDVAAPPAP
ncbi:hypothetical protein [Gordonia hongkongensis]|uniref:hypothetical protein n=1 Tax=Gordonia hongkongensis TaxID=1701090 RepID=UPI003EC0155E